MATSRRTTWSCDVRGARYRTRDTSRPHRMAEKVMARGRGGAEKPDRGNKLGGQVEGSESEREGRAEKRAREGAGESAGNNAPEKHDGKASRWRQRPRPPSNEKPGSPQPQGHSIASTLQAPESCEPDQRNTTATRWRQRPKPPKPQESCEARIASIARPPAGVSAPSL
ncbi:hypothetical protein HPB47_011176 [Ixodes persulcatus]|uniref:Uncharacterized protein n=1 Tax=Ixodes persulcatus TaxID=34615 RepID=A0AC60NX15_IXOPE|nr:hypothetical protein HPB47_011176 [Ixodes persulcatus]